MIRTFLLFSLPLVCISVFCLWLVWVDMQEKLHTPVPITDSVVYTIHPGMGLSTVLDDLSKEKILVYPHYLLIEAKRRQVDSIIKAGEYEILPGNTPLDILELFIAGHVYQYSLTLIEGWTFKHMMSEINQNQYLKHSLAGKKDAEIMEALGRPGVHPEGRFFPDTYHFPRGTSDKAILMKALNKLESTLREEWDNRVENLPYQTEEEALIMASIIEKETGVPEERAMIASVFVKRLQAGMLLQTDPTVIYAMGEQYNGNIRKKDLTIDSPYNTYKYAGLPPTPISLTGREAIHAALNPDPSSNALYFVAKGDGTHHFSKTLDEHNRAVARYQLGRDN